MSKLLLLAALLLQSAAPRPEATSLLGRPLESPVVAAEAKARMEEELAFAQLVWENHKADANAQIWLGRRTAYLGRFREAIRIFTDGIARHPNDARFYRHRGHRYITVREFDRAIADFEKAVALTKGKPDEMEPDGQPNARNIPTSSLQSNIWYHLALAKYLKGDFAGAADGFRNSRDILKNPDHLVAASAWMYISLRRAGRGADAAKVLEPIHAGLDVIENGSYLNVLLLHKGLKTETDVLGPAGQNASGSSARYGVSVWHLLNGRAAKAREMWTALSTAPDWPSFGVVAAEAELARKQ
jgi:tetratricopeptide (TPR) repeat protein